MWEVAGQAARGFFYLKDWTVLSKRRREKKTQEQKNNGCSVAHSHIIQERGACFAAPLVKCALPQRNVPQGGIPPLRYNVEGAGHTAKTVLCLPFAGIPCHSWINIQSFPRFLGNSTRLFTLKTALWAWAISHQTRGFSK